jgi:hypothetical protein
VSKQNTITNNIEYRNMNGNNSGISLIEPGVRSFLKISLQNCKQLKDQYYSMIFNVSAFVIFVLVVGSILFIKYKCKPTPEEQYRKAQEQREYVLSKLKLVNAKNFLASKEMGSSAGSINIGQITQLPNWNTGHHEILNENQNTAKTRSDEDYFMRAYS